MTPAELEKWANDPRIPSPRNDVVLILLETETHKEGEIIIPDEVLKSEPMGTGRVLRIGLGAYNQSGTRNKMDDLVYGDKVHFRQRGGTKIEVDGKEFFLVNDVNVFGIYDKEG